MSFDTDENLNHEQNIDPEQPKESQGLDEKRKKSSVRIAIAGSSSRRAKQEFSLIDKEDPEKLAEEKLRRGLQKKMIRKLLNVFVLLMIIGLICVFGYLIYQKNQLTTETDNDFRKDNNLPIEENNLIGVDDDDNGDKPEFNKTDMEIIEFKRNFKKKKTLLLNSYYSLKNQHDPEFIDADYLSKIVKIINEIRKINEELKELEEIIWKPNEIEDFSIFRVSVFAEYTKEFLKYKKRIIETYILWFQYEDARKSIEQTTAGNDALLPEPLLESTEILKELNRIDEILEAAELEYKKVSEIAKEIVGVGFEIVNFADSESNCLELLSKFENWIKVVEDFNFEDLTSEMKIKFYTMIFRVCGTVENSIFDNIEKENADNSSLLKSTFNKTLKYFPFSYRLFNHISQQNKELNFDDGMLTTAKEYLIRFNKDFKLVNEFICFELSEEKLIDLMYLAEFFSLFAESASKNERFDPFNQLFQKWWLNIFAVIEKQVENNENAKLGELIKKYSRIKVAQRLRVNFHKTYKIIIEGKKFNEIFSKLENYDKIIFELVNNYISNVDDIDFKEVQKMQSGFYEIFSFQAISESEKKQLLTVYLSLITEIKNKIEATEDQDEKGLLKLELVSSVREFRECSEFISENWNSGIYNKIEKLSNEILKNEIRIDNLFKSMEILSTIKNEFGDYNLLVYIINIYLNYIDSAKDNKETEINPETYSNAIKTIYLEFINRLQYFESYNVGEIYRFVSAVGVINSLKEAKILEIGRDLQPQTIIKKLKPRGLYYNMKLKFYRFYVEIMAIKKEIDGIETSADSWVKMRKIKSEIVTLIANHTSDIIILNAIHVLDKNTGQKCFEILTQMYDELKLGNSDSDNSQNPDEPKNESSPGDLDNKSDDEKNDLILDWLRKATWFLENFPTAPELNRSQIQKLIDQINPK